MKRQSKNLFIAGLLFFIVCSTAYAADVFYAAGRGTEKFGTVWVHKENSWTVHSEIPQCSEVFALIIDKEKNLWAAGAYFGYGKVWRYNKENGWDNGETLSDCRGVYSLIADSKGNLWAAGTGTKKVWQFNGKKWSAGVTLDNNAIVYSLVSDSKGNVWAGGEGKNQIWRFNGQEWDSGVALVGCDSVYCLVADSKNNIWAGGHGGKVLWWFEQNKWFPGIILLDSTEVSAFTVTPDKKLYSAGAGRNKIWLKAGELDWSGTDLDKCIAVYAVVAGQSNVVAGGWSEKRTGKVWMLKEGNWAKGTELADCYVIRALVADVSVEK